MTDVKEKTEYEVKMYCPKCHQTLTEKADEIYCETCGYFFDFTDNRVEVLKRFVVAQKERLMQSVINKVEFNGKQVHYWQYPDKYQLSCWLHESGRKIKNAMIEIIKPMQEYLSKFK